MKIDLPLSELIANPVPIDVPWLSKLASEVLLADMVKFAKPSQMYWLKGELISNYLGYTRCYKAFMLAAEIHRDKARVAQYAQYINGISGINTLLPTALLLFSDNTKGWMALSKGIANGIFIEEQQDG